MKKLEVSPDYEHNIIKALQTIIPECLFILSGRNGVEPKQPYCLVSIINETKVGMSTRTNKSELDINGNTWQTVIQDYEINYTMTFHGDSKSKAEEYARYLSICLDSDFGQRAFYDYGMGFISASTFPRLVVDNNSVRAYLNDTIDINVLVTRYEKLPVEIITRVEITGDYQLGWNPDTQINVGVGRNGEGQGENEWQ